MTRLSSDEGQAALLKERQEEIKLLKQQAITLQQTTAAAISKAEKKGNSDLEGKTKTAIMTAMKEALIGDSICFLEAPNHGSSDENSC